MASKPKRRGWIALHRKLLESVEWRESTTQHRVVLLGVLLMVNHEKTKHHDEASGSDIIVKRGQLLTTVSEISEQCGISRSVVMRALEKFGECGTGFWKVTPHQRSSLITIKNYGLYQTGKS